MSAYLTAVLADTPVHYWRLADPGGAIAHDIGSSPLHLFMNGNPFPLGYSSCIGDGGAALVTFNQGLASYVTEAKVQPLSAEALVFVSGYSAFDQDFFMGIDSGGNTAFLFRVRTDGKLQVFGDAGNVATGAAVSRQAWHHVAMTTDAATLTFYVDGASVGTAAGSAATRTIQYAIGARPGNSQPLAGGVAECAFYGTKLSSARISAHHAAIDSPLNVPVFGAAGGTSGGGGSISDPAYLSILQQILQSVRKLY